MPNDPLAPPDSPFMPVHRPGTKPEDYLNELLRDPEMMQKAIEQASNFAFGGAMTPAGGIEHLANLRAAGSNQEAFRAALDSLASDKGVSNEALRQIVKDYDAGVVMGKTRADHLRQLLQAFVRNARFENKLK